MVAILEDDLVYVEDFVTGPGGFPFAPGVTVTQIIEKAGGLDSAARKQKIYIRRLEAGHGAKTNIKVNWEAIKAGKEPDIPLLPNDVVIVPSGANFLSANGLLNFCASCSAYFGYGILPRVLLSNEPRIIR
jgi:protein involved in polysaccharide export with SLBB domain